ncbi:RING/FYVE/PHD zinc finger superfamily protein [Hibiscus syriacus]|uniref:RING/FYVE/PHD zinc finger superfamily protein n=2 Tax=Hibiscus syriacus TaxID=106335 RepID=A0A6A2XXE0_HIBSY|nr:RING/FYVE/PHD zinc finger superfamily protein [Hibiscus syriacus]
MQIKKLPLLHLLWCFLFVSQFFQLSHGDVGTAAHYSPPYLPTTCFGDDQTEFPSTNLFAAAGDGIWDNGASCGRQYRVRCISASQPGTCVPDQTIQVKIVDYAPTALSPSSAQSTTIVLSRTAFGGITNKAVDSINIEFQQ